MRLRRRVSSTLLNPRQTPTPLSSSLLPSRGSVLPAVISPSRPPPRALPASPRLLYCPVVLVLTLSRERNPFARRVPLPTTTSADHLRRHPPLRLPCNPRSSSLPSLCRRRTFSFSLPRATFPSLFTHDSSGRIYSRDKMCRGLLFLAKVEERKEEGEIGRWWQRDSFSRRQKREPRGSYECFGAPARP